MHYGQPDRLWSVIQSLSAWVHLQGAALTACTTLHGGREARWEGDPRCAKFSDDSEAPDRRPSSYILFHVLFGNTTAVAKHSPQGTLGCSAERDVIRATASDARTLVVSYERGSAKPEPVARWRPHLGESGRGGESPTTWSNKRN